MLCYAEQVIKLSLILSSTVSVFSEDKDCSVDSKNMLLVLLSWSILALQKGFAFLHFFIKYNNVRVSILTKYSLSKWLNSHYGPLWAIQ